LIPTDTRELESLVAMAQQATKSLDDEFRLPAFERVLDHLLTNSVGSSSVSSALEGSSEPAAEEAQEADGVLYGEQQRIDALARYFKIPPEDVQHIFDTSEEEPRLAIPTKHLAGPKSHATREIALLLAGALTAVGLPTTTSHIRKVTDDYGKLDSRNFMTTLTNLEEMSVLGKPRSPNRLIRMKVSGAEAAQHIAQSIVS